MFTRHILAIGIMAIGFVIGIIIAVDGSWKNGLIVGAIVVLIGFLFALVNMATGFKNFNRTGRF